MIRAMARKELEIKVSLICKVTNNNNNRFQPILSHVRRFRQMEKQSHRRARVILLSQPFLIHTVKIPNLEHPKKPKKLAYNLGAVYCCKEKTLEESLL